ncbi:MAG: hypothetical protein HY690_05650 [Chloroflexi bacterium]|nr:hypothetical protein [Chloroflexota bacterium]
MPPRRRQQYRRPPRRRPGEDRPDHRASDQALNAAARHLLSLHSLPELRALVTQSREAFEWADQQARQQPSPEALRRYRSAERSLAEAERALALAEDEPGPSI